MIERRFIRDLNRLGFADSEATLFLECVEPLAPGTKIEPEQLIRYRSKFKKERYVSQTWGNLRFNVRHLFTSVIPKLVAVTSPKGALLAFSAYQSVVGVFEIEVEERHYDVITCLYERFSGNVSRVDLLLEELGDAWDRARLTETLTELQELRILEVEEGGEFIRKVEILVVRDS